MMLKTYASIAYWPTRDLAPSTLAGYLSDWRNHVLPRWGDVDMSDISASDIEAWLSGMSRGVAENSLACLRRILRKAERDGMVDDDPTRKAIELPKERVPYQPKVLGLQDAREVLRGFYGHLLEAWVLLSLCSGTRRCESCALVRRDFNSREGFFSVSKGLQTVGGEAVEWFTKTPRSVRTVYLPKFATARLREVWHKGPLCDDGGERMNPDKVARLYRQHCQSAGLPFVPPTNLRHSYVGLALMSGAPMWWVQQQLGHAGGSSTLEAHYLWTDKTLGKRYARLLDDLLPEQGSISNMVRFVSDDVDNVSGNGLFYCSTNAANLPGGKGGGMLSIATNSAYVQMFVENGATGSKVYIRGNANPTWRELQPSISHFSVASPVERVHFDRNDDTNRTFITLVLEDGRQQQIRFTAAGIAFRTRTADGEWTDVWTKQHSISKAVLPRTSVAAGDDWNTLVDNGVYQVSVGAASMTEEVHAPVGAGGYGILMVLAWGTRYKAQVYLPASGSVAALWFRPYNEGTWRAWTNAV